VTGEQGMTLRFIRTTAPVDQAVAITTLTSMSKGQFRQLERILVYYADGEWRAAGTVASPVRDAKK
jgi:hypothetical protein